MVGVRFSAPRLLVLLVLDCDTDDLFVLHDTGAHAHSMGFQYNGKLRAPEILRRKDGGYELIRARDTIEGLYSNTVMPKDLGPPVSCAAPTSQLPVCLGLTAVAGGIAAAALVLARR